MACNCALTKALRDHEQFSVLYKSDHVNLMVRERLLLLSWVSLIVGHQMTIHTLAGKTFFIHCRIGGIK